MISKSLIIFVSVGIVAGLLFGLFLVNLQNTSSIAYVEGTSLSIVTDKTNYKKGEDITITIINSGTVPISFQDTSYGLHVTGLSGMLIYSPISSPVLSHLEPKEEIEFTWNQIKNDGNPALEGLYKIRTKGYSSDKSIENSITVNIWK